MENTERSVSAEQRLQALSTYIESPLDSQRNGRLIFMEAEGHVVYDHEGKSYIDLINGKGSIILGHNDEDVNKALQRFLAEKRNVLTGPAEPILALAEQIIRDIDLPDAKISFYTTGTAACRAAATTARHVTGKQMILSAGYHGWDPMWVQDNEILTPNHDGVIDFYFVPELLEEALKRYASQVALVIFSPDYTYLRAETLRTIISLCRTYRVCICCDDVKQGYRHRQGPSLPLVTSDKADIYTFSKGLANGLRLSCIVGRNEFLKGTRELTFTSYYDLLPIVAAFQTLQKMRTQHGYEHLKTVGQQLISDLQTLFKEYALPAQVYGNGPIFQFVFNTDEVEKAFYQLATAQGILLFEGDNQTISLCFDEEVLHQLLKRFEIVTEKLVQQFPHVLHQEISLERVFSTAWNMIDGAPDILPYEKRLDLIHALK